MTEKIVEQKGKFGILNKTTGYYSGKTGDDLADSFYLVSAELLKTHSDREVLPCIYEEIVEMHPYIYKVKLDGRVGLFYGSDRNCFLLKNNYQEVELIKVTPLIVKADGKYGGFHFGKNGLISLPPDYDEIRAHYSFWVIKKEGLWGLFQVSDGTFLANTKYRSLDVFELEKDGRCPSWDNNLIRADQKFGAIGLFENGCGWLEQPKHSLKKIEELLKTKHNLKIKANDRLKLTEEKSLQKPRFWELFRRS